MEDYSYLKPVQDRLKTLLDDLVDFANKAGVTYCLAYGSLLGAFRHKDIIPWDDDVDVVMLRDDYQKFVEYFRTHNTGNYKLSCIELDGSYALYAKLVRTSGDEDLKQHYTHPEGLCIDVFPLDEAYSYSSISQRLNEICIRTLKRAVVSKGKLRTNQYKESRLKHIVRWLFVLPFRPFDNKWLMEKAINRCKKDAGKGAPDLVFYGTVKPMSREHNKREYWFPTSTLRLGKKYYTVPGNFQAVLTTYYGPDYYKMPPNYLKVTHGEADQAGWGNE